jgi:hypothetical protein
MLSPQVTAAHKEQNRHEYNTGKWPGGNKEHASNSPSSIPDSAIYGYNLDDGEIPGGLKVRVITGPAAAGSDARQNAAIR